MILLMTSSFAQANIEAVPGAIYQTSKGYQFLRVENGWKDLKGITWFDKIYVIDERPYSEKLCRENGLVLPSQKDFARAESHGIREIFPDMKGRWFWSTVNSINSDDREMFDGSNGSFDKDYLRYPYSVDSCRCVSRQDGFSISRNSFNLKVRASKESMSQIMFFVYL